METHGDCKFYDTIDSYSFETFFPARGWKQKDASRSIERSSVSINLLKHFSPQGDGNKKMLKHLKELVQMLLKHFSPQGDGNKTNLQRSSISTAFETFFPARGWKLNRKNRLSINSDASPIF
jgi:hypothetical protein